MKILMLGWEYPPLVSGGLATATEGLVNGLIALGHEVTLILPYYPFITQKKGLRILSPEFSADSHSLGESFKERACLYSEFQKERTEKILASWQSYYSFSSQDIHLLFEEREKIENCIYTKLYKYRRNSVLYMQRQEVPEPLFYGLQERIFVLGVLACEWLSLEKFEVIHAHDWVTFPALEMVAHRFPHLPRIAHFHSTEADRSGLNAMALIKNIEKEVQHYAHKIVAVSQYTKEILCKEYAFPESQVSVVYNASNLRHIPFEKKKESQKYQIVSFVGRITYQKGPAQFVLFAKELLSKMSHVRFCVAGTGDLLNSMKQLAWEFGIDDYFEFLGFLDYQKVSDLFLKTDLFIMPSVSEPFGIVALEAVMHKVPVLLSKNSGVKEVLPHAAFCDIYDIPQMVLEAQDILTSKEKATLMVEKNLSSLLKMTWNQSALQLQKVYESVLS